MALLGHTKDHRVIEVGRDLWRLSGPSSLLKQEHLEQVAQNHIQVAPCPIPEGLGEKVREPDKLMVVAVVSNVVIALESSHLSLSLLQRKKGITSWVISQEEPGVPDILTKPDILFPR